MSLQEPSHDFSTPPSPEHSARKRPVSERRIQANRQNALRSTGPRTARGKHNVSRNAIKHGFLAREVVITAGDGKESLKEFHDLSEKLCELYEPVGVVEESLVQTIATCWWRKARVIRAENGEIRRRLDTLAGDRALRNSDRVNLDHTLSEMELDIFRAENQADRMVSSRERWSVIQAAQSSLREHPSGLVYLSVLLKKAKSEIASNGYISEQIRKKIVLAFCFWDCLFALTCADAGPSETKVEASPSTDIRDTEAEKRHGSVVGYIDDQLERISKFEELATDRENLALDAETRSFSLPPVDATDKLLRYEAHLDRQLYRSMDQLERLQRQRRGETVPPPLNINLGRDR
jgi:hypothetical protein